MKHDLSSYTNFQMPYRMLCNSVKQERALTQSWR